jgi:hypothetical protein
MKKELAELIKEDMYDLLADWDFDYTELINYLRLLADELEKENAKKL